MDFYAAVAYLRKQLASLEATISRIESGIEAAMMSQHKEQEEQRTKKRASDSIKKS